MAASLFYYKGFELQQGRPNVARWFASLEQRATYLGTQSDFHTHCHDLPPQMGGCFASGTPAQRQCAALVDRGPWREVPDTRLPEPPSAVAEAVFRVCRHRDAVVPPRVEASRQDPSSRGRPAARLPRALQRFSIARDRPPSLRVL